MTGELAAIVAELGDDERRVLVVLARRLLDGQRHYGRLELARDPRDFRRERGEELADALVYTAFMELRALARLDALADQAHLTTATAKERLALAMEADEHGTRDDDGQPKKD